LAGKKVAEEDVGGAFIFLDSRCLEYEERFHKKRGVR